MLTTWRVKMLALLGWPSVFTDVVIHQGAPAALRTPLGFITAPDLTFSQEEITGFFEFVEPAWAEHIMERAVHRAIDFEGQRIRANLFTFQGRRKLGCVIRKLPKEPQPLCQLGLLPSEQNFTRLGCGIVLIAGDAGHGKSTTIASIADEINRTRNGYITTFEETIETVIPQRKCIVTQRKVAPDGDVGSYHLGAVDLLRSEADVVVIDEIRDEDSAMAALALAETRALIFAGVKARSIERAIQRFLLLLGNGAHETRALAHSLRGVLWQTLVPSVQNERFYLATECLTFDMEVARCVVNGDMSGIRKLIDNGYVCPERGSHPLDAAVSKLVMDRRITAEEMENTLSRRTHSGNRTTSLKFPFFYHMTHRDNLYDILKHGILSHSEVLARDDILARDISDPGAQRWRDQQEPIYNRKIHDYAPLYINPKNPMLSRLREIQDDIVILKISPSVLKDRCHIFSDGNAASRDTKFSSNSAIVRHSIDALTTYWPDCIDGKRRSCAEVLVFPSVPPYHIHSIISRNSRLAAVIAEQTKVPVEVDSNMFF